MTHDPKQLEFLVIALFSSPIEVVYSKIRDVLEDGSGGGKYSFEAGELKLDVVDTGRPPAGGAHPKRKVLFEPGNRVGTTAMIPNMQDGWITLVNVLAKKVHGEHLLVRSSMDETYPVNDLEVWKDGRSVRYIGAVKEDPSWEFHERGEPLGFEDPAAYSKRRIRDRFNRDVLLATVSRAGWQLEARDFWQTRRPAFYLSEHRP